MREREQEELPTQDHKLRSVTEGGRSALAVVLEILSPHLRSYLSCSFGGRNRVWTKSSVDETECVCAIYSVMIDGDDLLLRA